jgi:hypothetical protein
MRSRRLAPALLVLPALLGGCGNDRPVVGKITQTPGRDARTYHYPRYGLTVQLPTNLSVNRGRAPEVLNATLGESYVSAFAYRRAEQLPRNSAELAAARRRLVRAVKRRAAGYELESSRTTTVHGNRAVELVGQQTISRRRLRIRSLHVFAGRAEYVLEVVSPATRFKRFDDRVYPRLRESLKVTGRVGARS